MIVVSPVNYPDPDPDDPGLTLTYFTARSNLLPSYGKKVKQWIFQKLLSPMI